MEQDESTNYGMTNESVLQNPNFMQLRLDTRPLLRDIELFLSAKRPILKESNTGALYEDYEVIGKPLANQEGITAMLNVVHLSANHHVVQGNIQHVEYLNLLADARRELTEQIVVNCYDWGIEDSKLNMIIDTIMRFLLLFLSRPVDNLERLSYNQQFTSREVVTQARQKPASAFRDFAEGIRG